MLEDPNRPAPDDAKVFKYEHNAWYVARNTLTTLAAIVLSCYLLTVVRFLSNKFVGKTNFQQVVRHRLILLTILIEIVLGTQVLMIWLRNVIINQSAGVFWVTLLCF